MGKHETITADISDEMALTIREAVEAGDFSDVGEVVRHALTEWRAAERLPKITSDELVAMLDTSLDSGPGRSTNQVLERLRHKYEGMTSASETRR